MQYKVLLNGFNDRKKHFETLSVSQALLFRIAIRSIVEGEPREKCLQRMKSIITPNITCDRLELILDEEYISEAERRTVFTAPPAPIPREVIEEMCKVWRVKTIRIVVNGIGREDYSELPKNYFSEFRLVDEYHSTPISTGIHFDHVEIQVETSRYAISDVVYADDPRNFKYDNMVENAVRLFPTKQISVQFGPSCCYLKPSLEKILRTVWKDGRHRNTRTTFRFAPQIFSIWSIDRAIEPFDIPETFAFRNRELSCTMPESNISGVKETREYDDSKVVYSHGELMGKTFTIRDEAAKCVLDLEILVSKEKLEQLMEKTEVNGFLKHFVGTCTRRGSNQIPS